MSSRGDKKTSVFLHTRIDRSTWKRVRLGDVGHVYGGLTGKSKEQFGKGNAKYITFLNVLSNTVIDTLALQNVIVSSDEHQNAVKNGDLFFNNSSETPEEVGMCACLETDLQETYLNSFCFGFRLTINNVLWPRFAAILFNSAYGRKKMSMLAQGATRYNLSKEQFLNLELEIPSYIEQKHIASTLSTFDVYMDSLKSLITKYESIKKATVNLLLKPNKDWQRLQVKDFAQVHDGTHQTPHYTESGIPFFSVENVTTNVFPGDKRISLQEHQRLTLKYKMRRGDVLMTRIGSIGACKLIDWDYDSSFYVSLAAFRFNSAIVIPEYFVAYSLSKQFQDEVNLRALPFAVPQKINLEPISEICIDVPSLQEQRKIAAKITAIDNVLNDYKKQLDKARNLKQGMMSYFFG